MHCPIFIDVPDAPGKPVPTQISGTQIKLTWTEPEFDGDSEIFNYVIERKEISSSRWMKATRESVADLTCTVNSLTEGTDYEFRVAAENKAGVGAPSKPSDVVRAKPPYDVPGPPSTPDISKVDSTQMTLTWTAPESDGGSPITAYIIERCDISRKRWMRANKDGVTDTTFTVTDLMEGNEYQFRVYAENAAGAGPPCEPTKPRKAKPPYDEPDAPGKPKVVDSTKSSITITWTEPENDGGSPITGYYIEKCETKHDRWMKVSKLAVSEMTYTVPGLIENSQYIFRVSAENKAGISKPSEPSDPTLAKLPYDVPSAPGKPDITKVDTTEMTLTWAEPDTDGGSPIVGYLIEKKEKFSSRWTRVKESLVTETTYTVADLKTGSEYQFRVAAENRAGAGKPSEPSDPRIAKPPYDVPAPPGKPSATDIQATKMTLTWAPPEDDGGSKIIGYVVEKCDVKHRRWSRAHKEELVTDTSVTVYELNEGSEYIFRVSAENAAGVGKPSQPSDVIKARPPYNVPSAPGKPEVIDTTLTSVTLTWTPPEDDGGAPLEGYVIERCDVGRDRWITANKETCLELEYTVTGLFEGNEYLFRVCAENLAGIGKPSEPTGPTKAKLPYDAPDAPGKPDISEVTASSLTLTWTPPDHDGGSDITKYVVEKKEKFSTRWVAIGKVSETTYNVEDLIESNEYEFRVAAENKAGVGKPSKPAGPVVAKPPYNVPDAPGTPDVTATSPTAISLKWAEPASDGGSPITGYFVERKDAFSTSWVRVNRERMSKLELTVEELVQGQEYEFRVFAENKAGLSKPSSTCGPVKAKHPFDVPDSPGTPKVSDINSTHMTLTWTAPLSDGGSEITGYFIEKREGYMPKWIRVNNITVSELTFQVDNLTEGNEYTFQVTAENKAGPGKPSEPSKPEKARPPYDVAGAPGRPVVSDIKCTSMKLTWEPPTSDGGSKITTYIVEKMEGISSRWIRVNKNETTLENEYVVTGLYENSDYKFRIAAENKAGVSKYSESSDLQMTYDVPTAPGKPSVTDVNATSISLTWTPPSTDGGSRITGYVLELKEKTSSTWTKLDADIKTTSHTVSDLKEHVEYEFRVSAENKAGTSPPSATAGPTETKPKIYPPGCPGIPDVTAFDSTEMTLTWTPPKEDGGSEITSYHVEKCDTKRGRWVKANKNNISNTTFTVPDLLEGTEYQFRVAAENAAGVGEYSEPSKTQIAKPPYDVPGPPVKLEIIAVDSTQMTLTWSPPDSDGGSPVINYVVEKREQFSSRWSKSSRETITELKYTVKELVEGSQYEFRVIAENKAGLGKPSDVAGPRVAKPPYDLPDAPGKPDVTDITEKTMKLTWTPPESDGGSEIFNYVIEKKDKFASRWTKVNDYTVSETTFVVDGLKKGNEYEFRISAENKAGIGKPSPPSDTRIAKPPYDVPGPPGTPTIKDSKPTSLTLTWEPPEDDGGAKVTGYVIEKKEKFSARFTKTGTSTETTFTVTDLTEGDDYEFRACAENKAGVGKPSNVVALKISLPDAPGRPDVSDVTDVEATLTWTPPDSDGGARVTGYIIEKRDTAKDRWIRVTRATIKEETFRVSDLIKDTEYEFRVSAENKVGVGEPSEPSKPVIAKLPYDVPGAPKNPEVSDITSKSAQLTWQPPNSDGGSEITGYIIERKDQYSSRWVAAGKTTELTYQVTDLKEGNQYEFRIAAENKAGIGKPCSPTLPITAKDPYDVPGAPGSPEATSTTETSVTLKWEPPQSDGGSAVLGYFIERKDKNNKWIQINRVSETTYTVTNLYDGAEYQFRVSAENKAGAGPPSQSSNVLLYDLPSAPKTPEITDVQATSMTLNWSPPESNGGSPIINYIIEMKDEHSIKWVKANKYKVLETTFKVDKLKQGNKYQFRIAAENKAGVGPASEPTEPRVAKPPYDVPDAPGKPTVSDVSSTSMVLTWEEPESDGGSKITGYIIEKKEEFSTRWVKVNRDTVLDLTFKITGLTESSDYQFRVAAENKAGAGKYSEPSDSKVAKPPYDVPDAPGKPDISDVTSTTMNLTWTPPDNDGGSAITGYIIEMRVKFSSRWSKANKYAVRETNFKVTDLKEGSDYEFRVAAENKAGIGKYSEPTEPRTAKPPYDVPSAPGQPDVSKVDKTHATLTWTPPESDGGSPITGFVIERCDVSRQRWTKAHKERVTDTTYTVTDLIEGNQYQFRVSAENKAGVGPASEPSKSITAKPPYDVPDAPSKPKISDITETAMTLTWTPPKNDGGSEITNYVLERKDKFSTRWTRATRNNIPEATYRVNDLVQGSEYEFRVAAENKAGVGAFSEPSDSKVAKPPYDVPGPPGKPVISDVTSTTMKLTWSEPEDNGGSPVTGYVIERKDKFSSTWSKVNRYPVKEMSYTVTDLKEGSEYEFRVAAENKAGVGKPSESTGPQVAKPPYVFIATSVDVPDAPSSPDITAVDSTKMTLKWTPPSNDGGSPITGYIIEKKDKFSARWTRVNRESVLDTEYTVTQLTEGSEYQFRVAAENKAGVGKYGEPSASRVAKPPYAVPDAPSKPKVSDVTECSMKITWLSPDNDGGSEIFNYVIEKKDRMATRWVKAMDKTVSETTCVITGLIKGTEYEFKIAAQNKAGVGKFGPPSDPVLAKPPYDVPGPPGTPTISESKPSSLTLTWSPPEDDGGAVVTGYTVERKEKFSSRWSSIGKCMETTFQVKDLIEGNDYEFRTCAENKAGVGKPSNVVALKISPPDAPGRPDVSEVTDVEATLTWTPPDSDGGARVTGYIVEKRDTTKDRWVRATRVTIKETSFRVSDLIRDTEYEFRVSAENKAGVSEPSQPSKPIVAKPPYDVPGPPCTPDVSNVSSRSLTLTWQPPEFDGGSQITGYVVERKDQYSSRWVSAGKTTELIIEITDLREGNKYEFRISAENKAGFGPPCEPTSPVVAKEPYDIPDAPGTPIISDINATSVTLTWSPPHSDGGSPIVGYLVERKEKTSSRWTRATRDRVTDLTLIVTGLTEGSEYEFRVSAENKAGVGPPSLATSPVKCKPPYDVPDAPSRPTVTETNSTSITITWTPPDSNGGSPITGYVIEKKDQYGTRWEKAHRTKVVETLFTVEGLKEKNEYTFRVAAENKAGVGKFSEPSKPAIAKPPYG
uniref:Titin-like n=1 Tax=Saccoglossus kowalevskii TaxID=10224 RepID=A0ABM0MSM4_SACKO|nr:PREDICTED: titin-like [Saccoglossus kowalevskii]